MRRLIAVILFCVGIFCFVQSHAQENIIGSGVWATVKPSGGGGSGSGWDTVAIGLNIAVTATAVTNDTVTKTGGNGYTSMRGTVSHTTGKFYYELVSVVNAFGFQFFGLEDNTTTNQSTMTQGPGTYANGCSTEQNGNGLATGSSFAAPTGLAGFSLSNGDVVGMAADLTNGFLYLRINGGAWYNSGDPTSGATGTGHICGITGSPSVYPVNGFYAQNDVMQLKTATFSFAAPSGYSPWN